MNFLNENEVHRAHFFMTLAVLLITICFIALAIVGPTSQSRVLSSSSVQGETVPGPQEIPDYSTTSR